MCMVEIFTEADEFEFDDAMTRFVALVRPSLSPSAQRSLDFTMSAGESYEVALSLLPGYQDVLHSMDSIDQQIIKNFVAEDIVL